LSKRLFGELRYQPPEWLRALRRPAGVGIGSGAVSAWSSLKRDKEKYLRKAATLFVVLSVLGGIYRWHDSRPRPSVVAVDVVAPAATPLKPDAEPFPLIVRFSASAAPLEGVGETVVEGVTLDPPHVGTWTWTSDRELRFVPGEDWAPGKAFEVRFTKGFFPDHIAPEVYIHGFRTAPFTVSIEQGVFDQDPSDPDLKRIVATLKFSHPVDPVSLKERIFFSLGGETRGGFLGFGGDSFPFAVSYNEMKGKAFIHSDRITIGPKETFMRLTLAKGVQSSRGGGAFDQELKFSIAVPGIYTIFRVQDVQLTVVRNEEYVPEQIMFFSLTTGVEDREIVENLEAFLLPKDRPKIQGALYRIITIGVTSVRSVRKSSRHRRNWS